MSKSRVSRLRRISFFIGLAFCASAFFGTGASQSPTPFIFRLPLRRCVASLANRLESPALGVLAVVFGQVGGEPFDELLGAALADLSVAANDVGCQAVLTNDAGVVILELHCFDLSCPYI